MYHVRTVNQMILNAENRGQHMLVKPLHQEMSSIRIIRTRQVKGIIQGYNLASGKWQPINVDSLYTL